MEFIYSKHANTLAYFVEREIIQNVSVLFYDLLSKVDESSDYFEDIQNVLSRPDYEQAALDAGWDPFDDEYGAQCWRDDSDGATWAGTAEDLCHEFNIEYDYVEAYEHWIVSSYLADLLEAQGELIAHDCYGLRIWGRTTTGQGISLDGVIARCCSTFDDNHYLVAMARKEEQQQQQQRKDEQP